MRLFTLIHHEARNLYASASTYVAAVLTLMVMGIWYSVVLFDLAAQEQEAAPATLFFGFFFIPALVFVPLLTMRSVAEERRLGTLQSLLATPVTALEVVFAKFVAAYAFYIFVWALSLAFPLITVNYFDQPDVTQRLLETGPLIGGYTFIALSGALFVAVGIFSSSLTRTQLVAGMLCFSIIFILLVGVPVIQNTGFAPDLNLLVPDSLLAYLQVTHHFNDFVRGVIDTRPVVYYLSSTLVVLGLAVLVVESKV
ncbi:MAG: ABC transporter permease subunit [Verrucomicrobiota bacterium JB022]|nr:ABC transporter permease subunit [Verrucomicrobiota bacterium JB022]